MKYDNTLNEPALPVINDGDDEPFDDSVIDIISAASDDGFIELILKMLALMCDGQHRGIQVRKSCFFSAFLSFFSALYKFLVFLSF